jgi:hypothetical protein
MKTPKRPDVKVPELKVPAFATDLYYDLRDRRLVPLVALVVVAIAAVPFLLGGKSEDAFVAPSGAPLSELGTSGSKGSKLTVVEATPGLRDYRKRLADRSPTNPFKQRYTGLPESAQVQQSGNGGGSGSVEGSASSGGGGNATVEVEGAEVEVETAPGHSEPAPGHSGGGSPGATSPGSLDPGTPGLHFFGYRPDVRFGTAGSQDLTLYHSLPLGKLLPNKQPVVVFIGVSEDGKRAAFDVSDEVGLVRGGGRCVGGNQSCGVLILHEGEAVDILTGAPNRDFRLAVSKIDFVEVDRSQKAHSSSAHSRHWGSGFSVVGQFRLAGS